LWVILKDLFNMNKVIIIAEAGVNHNGEIDKAFQLIDAAAEAKADFVKFQTFKPEKLVNSMAKKAIYQKRNTNNNGGTQFEMLRDLEIPDDWYPKLIERCRIKNIGFLSTGFDNDSVDLLSKFNMPFYKIPSGEITNKPYLKHVAKKSKKIILSTGMATLEEVKAALEVIINEGVTKDDVTILHCNTEYPTPMNDVNLLAMDQIGKELQVNIGYSDHTLGIEVSIAAVALGAKVIEKHFTIDRTLPGPDHAASLEPNELREMVLAIRNIEKAISGSGVKQPSRSEQKNIVLARKSIHSNKILEEGHVIKEDDLILLRPGNGLSPMEIEKIIGKKVVKKINKLEMIKKINIE